jgi:hypothetical protein
MPLSLSPPPIRFDESLEHVEPDEAETAEQLIETLTGINQTTLEHEKHAFRSVHAKSHALLTGELIIPDDLPRELAQGIFARAGRYGVAMRLSTVPGDILDDSVSTPRGMAVKIFGVEGDRLPGSEGDATQDFVLVNGPAFGAPTAKKFAGTLKLVAATTDRAEGAKRPFPPCSAVRNALSKPSVARAPPCSRSAGSPRRIRSATAISARPRCASASTS